MDIDDNLLHKQNIATVFSAAASTYDQAAFVEQEIGTRLLERLACIKIQPMRILDLGCGTGYFTQQLQSLFPQATIIGVDLAFGMAKYATLQTVNPHLQYLCADAEQLPFADRAFDLVFSNCCFMSLPDLQILSTELHRILNINGLLLFATLGPDSLKELAIDAPWLDMHHVGDALLHSQFQAPVVDTEILTFTYDKLLDLLEDLQATGAFQIDDLSAVENLQQPCAATFEVIYGHAWGKDLIQPQFTDTAGNVFVSATSIRCL